MKSIISVDVEDWFHVLDVPSSPGPEDWDRLPSRVEANFTALLDIFSRKDARVTCFFLGWIAERHPGLVAEARRRGHEIASHGYLHQLVYKMTPQEFLEDARRSKAVLEDLAGVPVRGYRAPGFSVTAEVPWFFDKVLEAGYTYDSSVFPAARGHGGLTTGAYAPHWIEGSRGRLAEFPITVAKVFGKPVCFFGGGYLRLSPYRLTRMMAARVLRQGRPVVFYIHPREIDPGHPRLKMSLARSFKSYVNLSTTGAKLARILGDFEVTTFEQFLADDADCMETQ